MAGDAAASGEVSAVGAFMDDFGGAAGVGGGVVSLERHGNRVFCVCVCWCFREKEMYRFQYVYVHEAAKRYVFL